jgi:hypothetical protein
MMKDLKNFLKGDLLGVHLAVNIFIATTVLWLLLRLGADTKFATAFSAAPCGPQSIPLAKRRCVLASGLLVQA